MNNARDSRPRVAHRLRRKGNLKEVKLVEQREVGSDMQEPEVWRRRSGVMSGKTVFHKAEWNDLFEIFRSEVTEGRLSVMRVEGE
jgi:hypothetical protein